MSGVIIDLTVPIRNGADGVSTTLKSDLPTYAGKECYAWDLEIPSHTGTYFETSAHVFRDGRHTSDFPADDLILPGRCMRIRHPHRAIEATDLQEALRKTRQPLPTSKWGLIVDVGERAFDDHAYFTRDAATWMVQNGVCIMGSNTPRYDTGFDEPTGFFIELFSANLAIVANIQRLAEIPEDGFSLLVAPLAVDNVCTVPCRVLASINSTT